MKRSHCAAALMALLLAGVAPRENRAHAAPSDATSGTSLHTPPRETGFLGATFHYWNTHKKTLPVFDSNRRLEETGAAPVILRFRGPVNEKMRRSYEKQGIAIDAEPTISGAYLAWITEAGLEALRLDASVSSIETALARRLILPINDNAEATGIAQARRALRAKDGTILDGHGVTLVDIDSGFFIFHPAFFQADAGAFAWKDVDGDGNFTVGADAIDLNGDGVFDEALSKLSGSLIDRYQGKPIVARSETFAPDLDYLFLDSNANGKRDYGAPAFQEDTPAYGEPMFVADDANRNGKLDPSEKILRLGTSKFKFVRSDKVYERGAAGAKALINYQPKGAELEGAGHGTGVAGILVGGQPGLSRFAGLAQAAELIGIDYRGAQESPAAAVDWAVKQGGKVLLTEYAPYAGYPLDGSSEEEKMFDAAFAKGVLTSSPAGNLAGGRKHRTVQLTPGKNLIPMQTARGFDGSVIAQISVLTRSAAALSGKIKVPGLAQFALPTATGNVPNGDFVVYADIGVTDRGTHANHFVLLKADQSSLAKGDYALELTASEPMEVDIYIGDSTTSWAEGFSFTEDTPSRTICHPSTADSVISVAAFVQNDAAGFYPAGAQGALASYSSRGPLLAGGGDGIELAAPDNPPSTATPEGAESNLYEPFGGTSGAGPHVAAALGLLVQLYPTEPASALKKRLLEGATPASGPGTSWGKGKLNLAKALGLPEGAAKVPVAVLEAPTKAEVGEITLRANVTGDDGAESDRKYRWDFDYDGTPDTEFAPGAEQKLQVADVGVRLVRVDVIAANGTVAAATAAIEFVPRGSLPKPAGSDDTSGCGCNQADHTDYASAALGFFGFALVRRRSKSRALATLHGGGAGTTP